MATANFRRAELARRIRSLLDQAAASANEAFLLMQERDADQHAYADYGRSEAPRDISQAVETLRTIAEEADDIIWYALK